MIDFIRIQYEAPMNTGCSEKQFQWAIDIRHKTSERFTALQANLLTKKQDEKVMKAYEIMRNVMLNTDARFWIDNSEFEFDMKWLVGEIKKALAN